MMFSNVLGFRYAWFWRKLSSISTHTQIANKWMSRNVLRKHFGGIKTQMIFENCDWEWEGNCEKGSNVDNRSILVRWMSFVNVLVIIYDKPAK